MGGFGEACGELLRDLGGSWASLERSLGGLGTSWRRGARWGRLGGVLGRLGGVLAFLGGALCRRGLGLILVFVVF